VRESIQNNQVSLALTQAQAEFKSAVKNNTNPFLKNKYANLGDVIDAIKEALAKHGLAFLQESHLLENDTYRVTTRILHKSGEWIEGDYDQLIGSKRDPQAFGAYMTYGKRFGLQSLTGCNTEDIGMWDDDGESTKANTIKPSDMGKLLKQQKAQETKDDDFI